MVIATVFDDTGSQSALVIAFAVMASTTALVLFLSFWRHRRDWTQRRIREEWLATMLRSIGDGVVATDDAGRVTFMNKVAQELTGWTEADALQKPLVKVFVTLHRQTREPAPNPIDQVVRAGKISRGEEPLLLQARDGAEHAVLTNAAPIRGKGDAVIGVVFTFRDVTDRELAESALRASQEMLRLITDHFSDLIAVLDLDGRRLYSSASHTAVMAAPQELFERSIFDELHAEDRERFRMAFDRTAQDGSTRREEFRFLGRGGLTLIVESVLTAIRDRDKRTEKILLVSRDLGERRKAEAKARQEMEFSDTLINSMPGVFYLYDARRKILRWNKNFETLTGYTAEEIFTQDPLTYFPDDEKPVVHERMLQCFATGSADVEVNLLSKNGKRTPLYATGHRIELDGWPCMLGVGIDISARRTAEEALQQTMERLRRQNATLADRARNPEALRLPLAEALRAITELAAQTLDTARASIWFYDDERTKISCADLYEAWPDRHSSGVELAAANFPTYFRALAEERTIAAHDAHSDPRTCEFRDVYLEPLGITSMLDAPIRRGGRTVGVVCHEHTGPLRVWQPDEQSFAGSVADLVSLSLEVENRAEAERALQQMLENLEHRVAERTQALATANERLQELDRLKSEFLATMSHELRTPLNSIIGFTGILRQGLAGPVNDEQKKQLGMVYSSARHLLGLINDLLDVSRVESGKMEIFLEEFSVAGLVKEVVDILAPLAEQKKIRLESQLDPAGLHLRSDRKKCFQILLNLANNAVKFTEAGRVRIDVAAGPRSVSFAVIDTGIGIRSENIPLLFEAFRQVDGSARRVYEGTGLGLYLCRQLSKMLGGGITVESEFGIGSQFTLVLPFDPPTTKNPPNECEDFARRG